MTFKSNKIEYPPFGEWNWRRYDGHKKADIDEFIKYHKDDMFFIGTDSQNYLKRKKICVFTTVLIAYKMRRGGAIITHTDRTPCMASLRQRLLLEAMRSLETAWYLDSKVDSKNIIGIHLDVNSNLKYKSAQYKEELVGLVAAQGFNALTKPDAWAASCVADSKC